MKMIRKVTRMSTTRAAVVTKDIGDFDPLLSAAADFDRLPAGGKPDPVAVVNADDASGRRLAAAVLFGLGRGEEIVPTFGPVVGDSTARQLHGMLLGQLNCPCSSSAGRWFDAAAGALGIRVRQAMEADAAMALPWWRFGARAVWVLDLFERLEREEREAQTRRREQPVWASATALHRADA